MQVSGVTSGTVVDSSGGVLPGVKVAAQNLETGAIRDAVTLENHGEWCRRCRTW